jgi:arsenate reductase
MDKTNNILVLCTGNSARSQMAEAYLKKLAGDRFTIYSAGFEPRPIHPYTIRVMQEEGIAISDQRSKGVKEFLGKMAFLYVITVCEKAEKNCPTLFPGALTRLYWPFEDPSAFEGEESERLNKYREIRDLIKERISKWIQEIK